MRRRTGWCGDFCDLLETLADEVPVRLRLHAGDEDLVEAREVDEVVPAGDAVFDVADYAAAVLGAAQAFEEFVGAAIVGPGRENHTEHGASGDVGVLVK